MFRTRAEQVSEWEAALPAEVLRLPEELARVDVLLDDPVFFAPFAPFFDPRMGRPSTPIETYLRLMFLKFRYRLGYESLCREVADSISWRRFCRIRLDGQVPHPTTLMKLTTRCGPVAVDACNEALLAKAAEAKLLRGAAARRHRRGAGERGLSDRLRAAGQVGPPDRGDRPADPCRRRCDPHPAARSQPSSRVPRARHRRQTAAAQRRRARRGAGHGAADHRRTRRPGRAGRRRRRA